MTGHLLKIQIWSFRNRIVSRLKRLRQIRYLAATLVGIAYVFLVWRPWRMAWMVGPVPGGIPMERLALPVEAGFGALLTVVALGRWLWPGSTPVLPFSEAEVAFLFPAPLTRRQLIRYSLIRSQGGILVGVFMVSFFGLSRIAPSLPFAVLACWVIFSTLQLHFLASTIVRSNLVAHGASGLRRSRPVLLVGVAVAALIAAWAGGWLRAPDPSERDHIDRYVVAMLGTGPLGWVIYPARLLVRPAFAADLTAFAKSIPAALGILVLNYLWVLRSDFNFEEASAEQASRRATERANRAATGRRRPLEARAGTRRPPFNLAPRGRPEMAILWKNLIATSRLVSMGPLFIFFAPALVIVVMVVQSGGEEWADAMHTAGGLCLVFAGVLVLIGPGIIRSDLRMDMRMIDLLKSYPLAGRTVILGEIAAPIAIITIIQGCLLAISIPLMAGAAGWSASGWAAVALGAFLLSGPLNLVTALVQNTALLCFPSWHRIGMQRQRGIEAFGQILIAGFLRTLVLALTLLPTAALLGAGLFFTFPVFGTASVPFIALVAAVPAIAEAWFGLEALGLVFERFDPSKELDVPT